MINGRVVRRSLRAGSHTLVIHHPAGQATKEHAHPAWTVLIPHAERISWTAGQGIVGHSTLVILPPQVAHCARSDAGHASVFIDPWFLGLGPGHRRQLRSVSAPPNTFVHCGPHRTQAIPTNGHGKPRRAYGERMCFRGRSRSILELLQQLQSSQPPNASKTSPHRSGCRRRASVR
jgi:hypothetical protein